MDLKKQALATLLGLAVGVASTFVFVWRDMAVLKAEMAHVRTDVALTVLFIASKDPQEWMAAKAKLQADLAAHPKGEGQ